MIDLEFVENILLYMDEHDARDFILDACLIDGYSGDPYLTKTEIQGMVTMYGRDLAGHVLMDTIRPPVSHVFHADPPQPKSRVTLWGMIDRAAAVGLGVFVGMHLLRK